MGVSNEVVFDPAKLNRFLEDVHNAAAKQALPSSMNRSVTKLRTRVRRRISQQTGVKQKDINSLFLLRKASRNYLFASLGLRARTPNAIRFGARETKKHLSVRTFRKQQKIKTGFIGNQGRTAFKREGKGRLPIRPVFGPNVARAYGAPKHRRVYTRYLRAVFSKEFDARYAYFAKRIQSRNRK